jgi:hypothetical protein
MVDPIGTPKISECTTVCPASVGHGISIYPERDGVEVMVDGVEATVDRAEVMADRDGEKVGAMEAVGMFLLWTF